MKCKHPDKDCVDRYLSHSRGSNLYCRLREWKRKVGVCPYDKSIHSTFKRGDKMKKKNKYHKDQKEIGDYCDK